jgi:hypothetical protein
MSKQLDQTTQFSYSGEDLVSMDNAKNYHNWILKNISPYLGQRVLEVGAGCGDITKKILAQNKGSDFKIMSLEPSKEMYPKLEKIKIEINDDRLIIFNSYSTDLVDKIKEFAPTSVLYNNVLEHIEDDVAEINLSFELLCDGGYLIKYSPALNWLMTNFDRSIGHFRRYYKSEAVTKVKSAGFKIIKAKYMDIVGIIPWLIFYKILKLNLSGNDTKLYDSIIIPIASKLEPEWLPIGKNVLVIGQKN